MKIGSRLRGPLLVTPVAEIIGTEAHQPGDQRELPARARRPKVENLHLLISLEEPGWPLRQSDLVGLIGAVDSGAPLAPGHSTC